jgi:hypothetical protein
LTKLQRFYIEEPPDKAEPAMPVNILPETKFLKALEAVSGSVKFYYN